MIILYCTLKGPDLEDSIGKMSLYVMKTSINSLFWTDGAGLYVYESHLKPEEIMAGVEKDDELHELADTCVVLEVKKFGQMASRNLRDHKILQAFIYD